ncbi:serine carboxypeptidase s28 domain-containing protein [Ditylenchus destructor]|uniref:Serine carboxypeptidase s28 domain-containing protein n=1 Tax=Ditylenchus destructor TaxID=166010 RepID=A0AAD4RBA0_9BILA|nr:serine carboxypeptidase s28 domain-containing protein [Ditylenchus destructor]
MATSLIYLLLCANIICILATLCSCDIPPAISLGGRPFFGRGLNVDAKADDKDDSDKYIEQKLNHTKSNSRTFQQRYFVNRQYSDNSSGLHILYIEGDSVASPSRVSNENYPHVSLAKDVKATIWALEHRYYGKSRPFKDLSTKNLPYLTSQQAIDDISDFIRAQNKDSGEKNPKWILIGGGYGGSLALWHRQKYPGLTIGAIGSGASATASGDFYEYQMNVESSYKSYSDANCFYEINRSVTRLKQLMQYNEGRDQLSDSFKLKPRFDHKNLPRYRDLQNFFNNIANLFQIPVQYDRVNSGVFANGVGIADVCKIFTNTSSNKVEKVVQLADYIHTQLFGGFSGLNNNYLDTVTYLKNESYNDLDQASTRAWLWQSCNEFGYFTTTDYSSLAFGSQIPNNFFINLCLDVFGYGHGIVNLKRVVKKTQKTYGTKLIYQGTNAVILRGSNDPWRSLAHQNTTNPSTVSVYLVNGGAHCSELQPPKSTDLYGVRVARNLIRNRATRWINAAKKNSKKADNIIPEVIPEGKPHALNVQPGHREIINWNTKVEWNISLPQMTSKLERSKGETKRHFLAKFVGHTAFSRRMKYLKEQQSPDSKPFYYFGYIHQDVDHFQNTGEKWKQLWAYNNGFKKKGGPIFLMVGGEAPLSWYDVMPFWSMSQWARQMGASVFALEHRFYGSSMPKDDLSVKNLTYLTSEQAIGDLAVFVNFMNHQYNVTGEKQKWIIFGGSYPGNLAAWFRMKYPDLSLGAVASSAPVQAKVDFFDYLFVVQNSTIHFGEKGCGKNIHRFFAWAQQKLMTVHGREELSDFWCICDTWEDDYVDEKDTELLLAAFIWMIEEFVQYDDEGHDFVEYICEIYKFEDDIVGASESEFSEAENKHFLMAGKKMLTQLMKMEADPKHYYDDDKTTSSGDDSVAYSRDCDYCSDFSYSYFIKYMQSYYSEERAWIWQTCNELGYFQSSNMGYNLFESSLPVNFYIDMCRDMFGDVFANRTIIDAKIQYTNDYYGGSDNYNGTNVVFVNGSEDPWHALGAYEFNPDVNKNVTSILIDGTSHCEDMYRGEFYDRPVLKAARKQIRKQIMAWLNQN